MPSSPQNRTNSITTDTLAVKTTARLSLKRQLLLWLLLPQLVLWLVGGTLAYRIALSYATRGIDQSLMQSVRSLARQVKPVGSGLLVDFPKAAQAIMEEDPDDRVSYMVSSPPGKFVLGNAGNTLLPPPNSAMPVNEPVLYDALIDGKTLRLVALELNYGDASAPQRMRVQVAKSHAVRQRIARELVEDMLVPLLLLGTVLGVMVYAGVARGLKPLAKLQAQIQAPRGQKSMQGLNPIEMKEAPLEVHALARALNQLLSTVRSNVKQEKRFLSDAAHQLRTPLAGLKSQLDLALTEREPALLKARLLKVNSAVERSTHLVHQLLSLARSEGDVEFTPLDVAQLAQEVAREWAPRVLAQGIDFGYDGEEHLQVMGNAILLREALGNLIDNAVRYAAGPKDELSSPGSPPSKRPLPHTLTVTLRAREAGGLAVVEVEDNGIGLNDTDRARAFERFVRASALPGGVGLGLPIVREIAQRHDGEVLASAVVPQGFRVEMRLKRL
jgi:two-component system sensor histidine kinase TctE